MIFVPGDFPLWAVLIGGLVVGLTTALIAAAIAAGSAAAAGGTAYGIKTAIEGNWPWEDPEGWLLGHLRAETGGLGSIISAAQGEPTLPEQLKRAGTSTAASGGVLQGATGQGLAQASAEALGQTPAQRAAGGGRSPTTGLQGLSANRWDAVDEGTPSRGDIMKGAAKDIGVGLGVTGASLATAAAGGALAPAAQAAGTFGNVVAGASSTAPAAAQAAAQAAPSVSSALLSALRVVPQTIGDGASGVLQQALLGAGKGALRSAMNDGNVGTGALSGAVSGGVGGALNIGTNAFADAMKDTFPGQMGMDAMRGGYSPVGESPFQSTFQMQPHAPTSMTAGLLGGAARPLSGMGGSLAGGAVAQAMTPRPPRPPEPMYPNRATYADAYDMGSPLGARRPWWS